MEQAAPKFMSQVKAKFVAPPTTTVSTNAQQPPLHPDPMQQPQVPTASTQTRQDSTSSSQRMPATRTSGLVQQPTQPQSSSSTTGTNPQQIHHHNQNQNHLQLLQVHHQHVNSGGSLSHRQMTHIEPIQARQSPINLQHGRPVAGVEGITPKHHKISLNQLMHNSANVNKRELSGLRTSHDVVLLGNMKLASAAQMASGQNNNFHSVTNSMGNPSAFDQHLQAAKRSSNNQHSANSKNGSGAMQPTFTDMVMKAQQPPLSPSNGNSALWQHSTVNVEGQFLPAHHHHHHLHNHAGKATNGRPVGGGQFQQPPQNPHHQAASTQMMMGGQMLDPATLAAQQKHFAMTQNQILSTQFAAQTAVGGQNNNFGTQQPIPQLQFSQQMYNTHSFMPSSTTAGFGSPVDNNAANAMLASQRTSQNNRTTAFSPGPTQNPQSQNPTATATDVVQFNPHSSNQTAGRDFNAAALAAQITQDKSMASKARTSTMLKGYNSSGGPATFDSASTKGAVAGDLSSATRQAELSQTHNAVPNINMIEGLQINGKRQPNFQINKQLQQVTGASTVVARRPSSKRNAAGQNANHSQNQVSGHSTQRLTTNANGVGNKLSRPGNIAVNNNANAQNSSHNGPHRPMSTSGHPPAQLTANLNLMRQLYSAKGGVQTPPANFKGCGSSSVGSRRQSGESSGMLSMGSIGTNFNEGAETVQKPLVKEFKTQGRLNNKAMMPSTGVSQIKEDQTASGGLGGSQTASNNLSRKSNAMVASLAKKHGQKIAANYVGGQSQRQRVSQKRFTNNVGNLSEREVIGTSPTADQSASQNIHLAPSAFTNETRQNMGGGGANGQGQLPSARASNTKKFKSISESAAANTALKSSRAKASLIKQKNNQATNQRNQAIVDSRANNNQFNAQSIFDEPTQVQNFTEEENQAKREQQPEQPENDISPTDITAQSHTVKAMDKDNNTDVQNISSTTPNKQSFSNQDAMERNEELMSLIACLNEQAIKELTTQEESEWETGMQRLLKAYKIMVETKNPNSFDANYKAIICYNLACCCQMQSELQDCSKYLTRAIEFVATKLDSIKEQAVNHYNQSSQNNSTNCQVMTNVTMDQPSLTTITNSSITANTMKKNSDIFEKKQAGRQSGPNEGQMAKGAKGASMTPNNRVSSANFQGIKARQPMNKLGNQHAIGGAAQSRTQAQLLSNKNAGCKTIKSPTHQIEKLTPGNSRTAASNQIGKAGSLYSEFSRFAANAGNQRQKVSQAQLRTISAANGTGPGGTGLKARQGGQGQKGAQSQAQFTTAKNGSNLFNNGPAGSTPQTRKQTGGQYNSELKKRGDGKAGFNFSGQVSGQPETVQVNQDNLVGNSKGLRDNKKKASKVVIQVSNWLDCYAHGGAAKTNASLTGGGTTSSSSKPPRELLERSIHLTRYYCRFVLQLCAVLSQLQEHEKALKFSKKASLLATELTEMTQILILDEIKRPQKGLQDTSGFGDMSSQKTTTTGGKRRKHSISNQLDPYNTTSLSKQKTTVSARFGGGAGGGKGGANSQNSSLVQSNLNQLSKDKVSQSYTMSNFNQLGAGKEVGSSTTLNNSGMGLSYFPNPEQIKNERESLERIHTFSLKEPQDMNASDDGIGAQTITGNILDPLLGNQTERPLRNDGNDSTSKHNLSMDAPFSGNRQRGISEGSRNSSTASNRSCSHYVPDKVKIFQKQIKNTHDIVHELISIQKEFQKISDLNFKERRDFFQDRMAEKKKLKISFQTFEEMNKLQVEQKFKITARSALGVKNYGTDDWIFSFNIGNIMHLQTLGFDELANSKTTQSMMRGAEANNRAANGLQRAGISGSVTTQQGLRNYLMSEISKDQLLYKALYVIVSYFCIGTELRFLATLNPSVYSLKDSEIWHAKAIHIASYFLPNDCPLIQHITQSYAKHHLRPKIKRRQDQLASLANY